MQKKKKIALHYCNPTLEEEKRGGCQELTRRSLAERTHYHPKLGCGNHAILVLIEEHESLLELCYKVVRQPVLNLKEWQKVVIVQPKGVQVLFDAFYAWSSPL